MCAYLIHCTYAKSTCNGMSIMCVNEMVTHVSDSGQLMTQPLTLLP